MTSPSCASARCRISIGITVSWRCCGRGKRRHACFSGVVAGGDRARRSVHLKGAASRPSFEIILSDVIRFDLLDTPDICLADRRAIPWQRDRLVVLFPSKPHGLAGFPHDKRLLELAELAARRARAGVFAEQLRSCD